MSQWWRRSEKREFEKEQKEVEEEKRYDEGEKREEACEEDGKLMRRREEREMTRMSRRKAMRTGR